MTNNPFRSLFIVAALAGFAFGCSGEETAEDLETEAAEAAEGVEETLDEAAEEVEEAVDELLADEPTPEELPVAADFEAEAEENINEDNYADELEAIEAELEEESAE